jgi:transmembrane sensor
VVSSQHDVMRTSSSTNDRTSPDRLEEQAWSWLRLLASGDVKESDLQRFRRWIGTSPAHQAKYSEIKQKWDVMGPLAAASLRRQPDLIANRVHTRRVQLRSRRVFLGAAASFASVAAVAAVYPPFGLWPVPAEWSADYRTAPGEQRTIALADQVDVTLNTRTSARREVVSGETVGLDLITGEAAIDLKGSGRAFSVTAGTGRSASKSGQFEVRHLNARVCVTCISGSVQVAHPAGERALLSRQQVIYNADEISGIASIDPADVAAWRKGLLVFHQARMIDVIDEINRYRPGRVILMKDAVRNKAVSGNFAIASLDLALWQLQQAFDLHAQSLVGGLVILS